MHRQIDPATPIPTYDTGPITRKERARQLAIEKEDTEEMPVLFTSSRRTTYPSKHDLEPTVLLFAAARDHIRQQADKTPPRRIYVCSDLYLLIMAGINSQSREPFMGHFLFSTYDKAEAVPIVIERDYMIGECLPMNVVICIH